jgi:hypothetical protein
MIATAELDRLAARVRASARDGGLIETAQVKLLGLDEVRQAAGARWPRMREHVREGSLKIIAQRIGAHDAVIPCGDGFLVVFADPASGASERCCREIRDALISFYLGEEALRRLSAELARDTMSAAALAEIVSAAPNGAQPAIHASSARSRGASSSSRSRGDGTWGEIRWKRQWRA